MGHLTHRIPWDIPLRFATFVDSDDASPQELSGHQKIGLQKTKGKGLDDRDNKRLLYFCRKFENAIKEFGATELSKWQSPSGSPVFSDESSRLFDENLLREPDIDLPVESLYLKWWKDRENSSSAVSLLHLLIWHGEMQGLFKIARVTDLSQGGWITDHYNGLYLSVCITLSLYLLINLLLATEADAIAGYPTMKPRKPVPTWRLKLENRKQANKNSSEILIPRTSPIAIWTDSALPYQFSRFPPTATEDKHRLYWSDNFQPTPEDFERRFADREGLRQYLKQCFAVLYRCDALMTITGYPVSWVEEVLCSLQGLGL